MKTWETAPLSSRIHAPDHERPHLCPDCGRGFARKGELEAHRNVVHIKSRPYACRFGCGEAFNHYATRGDHEKSKHGMRFPKTKTQVLLYCYVRDVLWGSKKQRRFCRFRIRWKRSSGFANRFFHEVSWGGIRYDFCWLVKKLEAAPDVGGRNNFAKYFFPLTGPSFPEIYRSAHYSVFNVPKWSTTQI